MKQDEIIEEDRTKLRPFFSTNLFVQLRHSYPI